MSPTAETQFCFLLSVDLGMWTFSSWKWQEQHMSEKSVPYHRRPCLSSTCVTKCSNPCAAILNLFSSAVNRSDFLSSWKRKWSACSKWLPEWLREDKNYCLFIPAKSAWKQMNWVHKLVEGVNVREDSICLRNSIVTASNSELAQYKFGWKWWVLKCWGRFSAYQLPVGRMGKNYPSNSEMGSSKFVVSPVAEGWV